MPPPLEVAVLLASVLLVSVSVPALSIPPPEAAVLPVNGRLKDRQGTSGGIKNTAAGSRRNCQ